MSNVFISLAIPPLYLLLYMKLKFKLIFLNKYSGPPYKIWYMTKYAKEIKNLKTILFYLKREVEVLTVQMADINDETNLTSFLLI